MLAFKPERLGHMCCLDAALSQQLAASGIPVELCLSSNVITESVQGIAYHHFEPLRKSGSWLLPGSEPASVRVCEGVATTGRALLQILRGALGSGALHLSGSLWSPSMARSCRSSRCAVHRRHWCVQHQPVPGVCHGSPGVSVVQGAADHTGSRISCLCVC